MAFQKLRTLRRTFFYFKKYLGNVCFDISPIELLSVPDQLRQ